MFNIFVRYPEFITIESSPINQHPRRPRGSQSGAGEMARRKFSRTGGRTPGYQVSPDHFQTASRIPAPDWAEKIPALFCVFLIVCSYTAIVVLPYLSCSFTKVMRARETFILTFPTGDERTNEAWKIVAVASSKTFPISTEKILFLTDHKVS